MTQQILQSNVMLTTEVRQEYTDLLIEVNKVIREALPADKRGLFDTFVCTQIILTASDPYGLTPRGEKSLRKMANKIKRALAVKPEESC